MRFAFDLDNTLIRCGHDFSLEKPQRRFWAKMFGKEQLREGTKALTDACRQRGWQVWVYTTSYRSTWHIRWLFWLHGIRLDGVVNQQRHDDQAQVRCTKHPPSFGIDLLIDDSEGVRIEGQRHGFQVLVIVPNDAKWTEKVIAVLNSF